MFKLLAALAVAAPISPLFFQAAIQAQPKLNCVSSVVLFSGSGRLGFDIPDSARDFWGVTIERDQAGTGRRSVVDEGRTGGTATRPGWKRGFTEINPRPDAASWRYLLSYTLEKATECVVSSTVQPTTSMPADHAVTVPESATIESIEISTIDTETNNEQTCAKWPSKAVVPAVTVCEAGSSRVSFSAQKYTEPANPPITEGIARVPPIYLEAAQGWRFGCTGVANNRVGCRIEVRWHPR